MNIKCFVMLAFSVLMMVGCASYLSDAKYETFTYALSPEPDKKQFDMKTTSLSRHGARIDVEQLPIGEQIYHYSGPQLQLRVFVSPELQCADSIKKFFSFAPIEDYVPLSLLAGNQLNYEMELHLVPLSSFKHRQTSSMNRPQLKFFRPFQCSDNITYWQMLTTLVPIYHEMGHLEAFAGWPGGWQISSKDSPRRYKSELLVQEIIAAEFELCAQFLMPIVERMTFKPATIWEKGEAAAIKAIIEELMPTPAGLTAVGREIGHYQILKQINQFVDTKDKQQYQHIFLKHCKKVTTPEHINQRLVQFGPYQKLL